MGWEPRLRKAEASSMSVCIRYRRHGHQALGRVKQNQTAQQPWKGVQCARCASRRLSLWSAG